MTRGKKRSHEEINQVIDLCKTMGDASVSKITGIPATTILYIRRKHGISPFVSISPRLTEELKVVIKPLLGTKTDKAIEYEFSLPARQVSNYRKTLGIAAYANLDAWYEATCATCNESFQKRSCNWREPENTYCSYDCSDVGRQVRYVSEANRYGRGWQKARQHVRKRDVVCQRCGETEEDQGFELDVHHKIPFRMGGKNHAENLVLLCHRCHQIVENETKILFEKHVRLRIELVNGKPKLYLNEVLTDNN